MPYRAYPVREFESRPLRHHFDRPTCPSTCPKGHAAVPTHLDPRHLARSELCGMVAASHSPGLTAHVKQSKDGQTSKYPHAGGETVIPLARNHGQRGAADALAAHSRERRGLSAAH